MPENQQPELFESVRSRFSENYLRREHKTLLTKADIALTELVANAWDAGASLVEITIPSKRDGVLSIEDDGTGMAADEFLKIWPELRYDRLKARGRTVTFPPNVNRTPRVAYGSNGIGRHAMLCFCSTYEVDTTKAGERARFEVTESSGESAIDVRLVTKKLWTGHGTKMSCKVKFILPDPVEMLEVLSARFAHDPEFVIRVNGQAASLEDHSALVKHTPFTYGDGIEAQLFVLDTQRTARTVGQHGVTFWVGKRRVGTPSWDRVRLDGRLKEARRITFIVRTDAEEIRPDVREDWTGFRETKLVNSLYEATEAAVLLVLTEIFQKKTTERTEEVIEGRREAIRNLDPLAQVEVAQLAREVATEQPLVSTEILTAAVDALIRIENSRSGQALIQKLAKLTPEDVDGLNLILEEWTIKDALTVLGEVGRRLRVVEAISRLSEDKLVDELHTLHPLVAQARWLFGIEFDTPAYISNISLNAALRKITAKKLALDSTLNRRSDLLVLNDGTIGATALDDIVDGTVAQLRSILLIELKKGGATIGREEMDQANGYADDLMASKDIDGFPTVYGFVVGDTVDQNRVSERTLSRDGRVRGFVKACSYKQLVRTADARLHHLRKMLDSRLPENADSELVRTVLAQGALL